MPFSANDTARLLRAAPLFGDARELHWAALGGGSSNRVLRVTADGAAFAVRLPAPRLPSDPRLAPRDEWRLLKALGARGLTPEPVWHDKLSGLLVTRFHAGPVWTRQRMRQPAEWPALVALLRRVHATQVSLPVFQPVAAARSYWAHYEEGTTPERRAQSAWRRFETEQARLVSALQPTAVCHNDIMFSNVIGTPPRLLDWEYAACSDPLFDVATVIVYHRMDTRQSAALLSLYLGGGSGEQQERLQLLCRLCRYLSGFWWLARSGQMPTGRNGSITLPAQTL